MTHPAGDGRLLTPAFLLLTVSELAYFTALGVFIPVVPLYAGEELGADAGRVGLVVGAFSISALLLRPLAGRAADRLDLRRLMQVGGALFALVAAAHLVVDDYGALLGLRVLLGAAEAVYFVGGITLLAALAPAERVGEALSYNSLGLYLGIAVGPAVGEQLLRVGGYPAAWTGAAALGGLATALASSLPRRVVLAGPAEDGSDLAAPLAVGRLLAPGAAFVCGLVGAAGFLAFVAIYARELGLGGAGGVLAAYGAVVVASRLALARIADRWSAELVAAWSLLLAATGLAVMAGAPSGGWLYPGAVLLGLGVSLLTPAAYRVVLDRVPASRGGSAAAAFSIMVDIGLGLGPLLLGGLAGPAGLGGAFAAAAVVVAVGAGLMLLTRARSGRLRTA